MKKLTKSVALCAVLAATCLSSPAYAALPSYTFTDLGTLGGAGSIARDVNNNGQVVGESFNSDGQYRAFLYDGTMHDLGGIGGGTYSGAYGVNNSGKVAGFSYLTGNTTYRAFFYDGTMRDVGIFGPTNTPFVNSWANGLNNAGQVVGYSHKSDAPSADAHAFLYDGTMHDLGTLGGSFSEARAINNQGIVVGEANLASGYRHAFLYDGTMHDLGGLGGPAYLGSSALSVNDHGQVVGYSGNGSSSQYHAFLYDGVMHDLGTLGGTYSQAFDINNLGQVVGLSNLGGPGDATHSFFYSDGVMVDLESLISGNPFISLAARAINDNGWIVGNGTDSNGVTHAILLTPTAVPLPATAWLLGSGLLGLMGVARRKAA